jgi:hypothetical protein
MQTPKEKFRDDAFLPGKPPALHMLALSTSLRSAHLYSRQMHLYDLGWLQNQPIDKIHKFFFVLFCMDFDVKGQLI